MHAASSMARSAWSLRTGIALAERRLDALATFKAVGTGLSGEGLCQPPPLGRDIRALDVAPSLSLTLRCIVLHEPVEDGAQILRYDTCIPQVDS
jgi:hypothetical protein